LLIKSYSSDPAAPDAVALCRSRGSAPVLPGTSVMGAVRHRAAKILQTLGANAQNLESMVHSLFGFVEEENSSGGRNAGRAVKGRVQIEETFIRNVLAAIQTRIKIDRFTGGARHGALFEMMPLWQNSGDDAVNIVILLRDYEDWEAGLLLYVLKDLWTGDLAIGGEKNIGRGILEGRSAKISWNEGEAELKAGPNGSLEYDPAKLKKLEELFTGSC
jgi:CRISPR/Cas system CSM-associated protein Csm3 (group 7 of RAMP superfamily)